MVVTKKKLRAQKARGFYVKEDNSARKFMTKDQALADNERLRKDNAEVEALKAKQADRRKEAISTGQPTAPEETKEVEFSEEKQKKIGKIIKKIEAVSGKPGAVNKRKEFLAEIEKIKGEE